MRGHQNLQANASLKAAVITRTSHTLKLKICSSVFLDRYKSRAPVCNFNTFPVAPLTLIYLYYSFL